MKPPSSYGPGGWKSVDGSSVVHSPKVSGGMSTSVSSGDGNPSPGKCRTPYSAKQKKKSQSSLYLALRRGNLGEDIASMLERGYQFLLYDPPSVTL